MHKKQFTLFFSGEVVMHGTEGHSFRFFTLIELMAIVAIIAVLANMLLPALTMAREKSREAKCLSNVRQINTGITLYYEDFGYFPYGNSAGISFPWSVNSYVDPAAKTTLSPLFECPGAMHSTDGTAWVCFAAHPVIMPDFFEGQTKFWRPGKPRRPSEMMTVIESCQMVNAGCYPTFKSVPGVFTAGNESEKDNLIIGDFARHDEDSVDSNAGWPRFRHRFKSGTLAFIDSHVASTKIGKITEGNVKTNY